MASKGAVEGQYMHPIISEDTQNSDPWSRNYFQPPSFPKMVPRVYPLIDIRPAISHSDYTPADLLKSHGFGIVKHRSALLEPPYMDHDVEEQAVLDVYNPEIEDLVKRTTGAKTVFIMASVHRRGKPQAGPYVMPLGLKSKDYTTGTANQPGGDKEPKPADKPTFQSKLNQAAPVRTPHLDFTPQGARVTIRSQDPDIRGAAVESGVIAAEDNICKQHNIHSSSNEADAVIAEHYNQGGKLGPRYAAYSIWRPLKKVGRDPITLAPRRRAAAEEGERVYWPYLNKIPGSEGLGGDFLKEYAMLGVKGETPPAEGEPLDFYYLSAQEPDEVLFIKLFDSASLGDDAEHARSPWHASPEIGEVEGSQPRESIDIRILAFW